MDLYHIWCDLKPGESDVVFCDHLQAYLAHLRDDGLIESFRITRRKLGLGPADLGEFHIIVETRNLAQLDAAFRGVSARSGRTEVLHHGVNSRVDRVRFALYRDFPDPGRQRGEERF